MADIRAPSELWRVHRGRVARSQAQDRFDTIGGASSRPLPDRPSVGSPRSWPQRWNVS